MSYTVPHYINGKFVATKNAFLHPIYNPATGEIIGQTVFADKITTEQAIQAAKAAQPEWAAMPAVKRARILFKYKELLEKHIAELAELITKEHGKTLADAKGSIMRGVEALEVACGTPNLLKGWF